MAPAVAVGLPTAPWLAASRAYPRSAAAPEPAIALDSQAPGTAAHFTPRRRRQRPARPPGPPPPRPRPARTSPRHRPRHRAAAAPDRPTSAPAASRPSPPERAATASRRSRCAPIHASRQASRSRCHCQLRVHVSGPARSPPKPAVSHGWSSRAATVPRSDRRPGRSDDAYQRDLAGLSRNTRRGTGCISRPTYGCATVPPTETCLPAAADTVRRCEALAANRGSTSTAIAAVHRSAAPLAAAICGASRCLSAPHALAKVFS